jgi:hypothetical protein
MRGIEARGTFTHCAYVGAQSKIRVATEDPAMRRFLRISSDVKPIRASRCGED